MRRKKKYSKWRNTSAQNSVCQGLDAHGNMTHLRNREEAGQGWISAASWGLGEAERPQVPDGAGSWRSRRCDLLPWGSRGAMNRGETSTS